MGITLEDLRGDSPAICGEFNKIREEVIRDAGEDQNEVCRMLTERVLMGLDEFFKKKRKQRKTLESDLLSLSFNWKLKRQRNKPLEQKKRVVLRTIPPKKPLELAPNNTGNINKNEEEEEEEEEEEKSRKTKKQRKNPTEIKQEVPDRPVPCIPTEFKDKIMGLQGSESPDINLVIQKELTDADTNASQARLSIPRGQMRYDFLSGEEQVSLDEKDGKRCKAMEVPLIEPGLQVSTISLKKWKLGRRSCYMLGKPWIEVTKRNQLKPSNTIQLWSFRVDQKLHLALIKLGI